MKMTEKRPRLNAPITNEHKRKENSTWNILTCELKDDQCESEQDETNLRQMKQSKCIRSCLASVGPCHRHPNMDSIIGQWGYEMALPVHSSLKQKANDPEGLQTGHNVRGRSMPRGETSLIRYSSPRGAIRHEPLFSMSQNIANTAAKKQPVPLI